MAAKKKTEEVEVMTVEKGHLTFHIVGTSPLILNRMSEKARRQLLLPSGRKTAADKASTLKHVPYEEFQCSPYIDPREDAPTLLTHLASAFKGALRGAAVDLPKLSKAQIGRLVRVEGERINIWGHPKMLMSVTRSADVNKTPDIRTRCILPEWCCDIDITFVKPLLREKHLINLLSFSGITQGTGDWRAEKGSGNYGSFEIANADDPRIKFLKENYGREFQMQAMIDAEPYDRETAEEFQWYNEEVVSRGFKNVRKPGDGLGLVFADFLQTNPPEINTSEEMATHGI